jgi:uncharacterized protein YecT (DUF1311 family)
MEHLTANQVALVGLVFGLLGGLVGWLGRGLSFVLKRWWTGSGKQERATYLNTVADFAAKMRAHGVTLDDVRELEAVMQNPAVASSPAATEVVERVAAEVSEQADTDDQPMAFLTNYAMKVRTGESYKVAEAELDQALADLQLLLGEREWACVQEAQEHWRAYRNALSESARLEFEGGTHAGLAATFVGLTETERRTAQVREQVNERAAR